MTLGHAAMALEVFYDFYLYVGLSLLILGNGLFKPNISSIVGQMYKDDGKIKDAAYTCLLYTSPSPRDQRGSRMPSSA